MFNTHHMVSTVYTDYIHQYLWDCVNQIVLQLVVKISAKVNAKYFSAALSKYQYMRCEVSVHCKADIGLSKNCAASFNTKHDFVLLD